MESFITTFHIDWKILIAQSINFGIIFIILYFFALKPLRKIMDERTNTIEKGIADAKENSELVILTRKEYENVIAKARAEAHEIFQEGKREAETKKAEMLEKAQSEVDSIIMLGKKNLEIEKNKMIEEAKNEIVSLVVLATEKVLKDESTSTATEKAVKKINRI